VRYRLGVPTARAIVRKVAAEAGDATDVRRTGRIRTLGDGAVRPRPPVITAQALGETDRVRPLRPGVSIAHVGVTAGTLGAFVHRTGEGSDDARYVEPEDRVGELADVVPLTAGERATVDAAIARLDDGVGVGLDYPVGRITTTARVEGTEEVAKIGRTTALTQGRVTAIELDDVLVGYGEELGVLTFDDQIEVESTGKGPFSRGGDSGSLVYRSDGVAIGLLFAGSETGGTNGTGLTYVNPIDTVLEALGVRLAT
jgi:hypothetical protein